MGITLRKGEVVGFKGSLKGIIVQCNEGLVWVTVAGDRADYILTHGAELSVKTRGKVAIVAEEESFVWFYKPVKITGKIQHPALKTVELKA